jgi:hypothetical protein
MGEQVLPLHEGKQQNSILGIHWNKPDNSFISHVEWGCRAYLHVEKKLCKEGKFDPTALSLVFVGTAFHLGYETDMQSTLDGKHICIARHNVTIDRSAFPWRKPPDKSEPSDPLLLHQGLLEEMDAGEGYAKAPQFVINVDLVNKEASQLTEMGERITSLQLQCSIAQDEASAQAQARDEAETLQQATSDKEWQTLAAHMPD